MENNVVVQRIVNKCSSPQERAEKYYSIMSVINGIRLTKMDIQLIAFTAIRGNISESGLREEFATTFDSSIPSVGNVVYKLRKKGILVMNPKGDVIVNPRIGLDFDNSLVLNITLGNG